MMAYRVDKQDLTPGQELSPGGFYDQLDSDRKSVEELLERFKPEEKPSRRTAIFVFAVIDDAKMWAKERFTRKLYRVEVNEADILHRGDWKWPAKILKAHGDLETQRVCAESYWKGEKTSDPVIELMVRKALVVDLLPMDQEKLLADARKKWEFPSPDTLRVREVKPKD
jgi:hypothetical protein